MDGLEEDEEAELLDDFDDGPDELEEDDGPDELVELDALEDLDEGLDEAEALLTVIEALAGFPITFGTVLIDVLAFGGDVF